MANIFTDESELTPGKWYALGIRGNDDDIDWGGAQLLLYQGESCWCDEAGAEVDRIWDSFLQTYVHPGAADQFAEQS